MGGNIRLWVLLISVISAYPFGAADAQPPLASSSQTSAVAVAEAPLNCTLLGGQSTAC